MASKYRGKPPAAVGFWQLEHFVLGKTSTRGMPQAAGNLWQKEAPGRGNPLVVENLLLRETWQGESRHSLRAILWQGEHS